MRTIFKDVRGRLLPGIIIARLRTKRGRPTTGGSGPRRQRASSSCVSLAGDPDLNASDAKAVQEYKVLADGFQRLAVESAAAAEAAAKKAAEPPVPPPSPEKPADAANVTAALRRTRAAPNAPRTRRTRTHPIVFTAPPTLASFRPW